MRNTGITCACPDKWQGVKYGKEANGMYCFKCGKQIDEGAQYCPHCGAAQGRGQDTAVNEENVKRQEQTYNNTIAICGIIFAFLMPIVGFVLGLISAMSMKVSPLWRTVSLFSILISVVIPVVTAVLILV